MMGREEITNKAFFIAPLNNVMLFPSGIKDTLSSTVLNDSEMTYLILREMLSPKDDTLRSFARDSENSRCRVDEGNKDFGEVFILFSLCDPYKPC